eukprot:3454200-Pyramimonas_sp.AAC.1
MPRAVCRLACPTFPVVVAVVEDASGEVLIFAHKQGRQRVSHSSVHGQIAGLFQAVCLFACPTSSAVGA